MATITFTYIESTPDIFGGKPCIAGTRVRVQDIVVLHEFRQWPVEQVASEMDLTLSQVYAALAYYHDHRAEMQKAIRSSDSVIEQSARPLSDFLADRRASG